MSVIAFHEKAGRSQGDWFWYLLVTLFLSQTDHTLQAKLRNYVFPLVQGHSIDALKCENIGQAG